jgi:hypothetical protein
MCCPQTGQWRGGKTVLCSFGCVPWIVTDLRELSGRVGRCQLLSHRVSCARRRSLGGPLAGTLLQDS